MIVHYYISVIRQNIYPHQTPIFIQNIQSHQRWLCLLVFMIQYLILDNVRMQFKKHFSNNLHNLAVKKTYVVNQPANISHSIDDNSAMPYHYEVNNHEHAYHSNKENVKINNGSGYTHQINFKNTAKVQMDGEKHKKSPLLTFNKLKTMNSQKMDEVFSKKSFVPLQMQQGNHIRNLSTNKLETRNHLGEINYNQQASSQYNQLTHHTHPSKVNIRYGSMLFGHSKNSNGQPMPSNNSAFRESRSFDKIGLKQHKYEFCNIPCINNDGKYAKYKVVKDDYQDQILYYCFNCAIYLVKQGFSIQELSNQDKHKLNLSHSNYNPQHQQSYTYQEEQRQSIQSKTARNNSNVKLGEGLKCKIIMKLNKLKVGKEEFNKNIQNHLQNIDYFYNSLIAHIEQQKINDKNEILRIKSLKKSQPQNYENMLGTSLGTIDYMMRSVQNVNHQITDQIEEMLQNQVIYPRIKINIEPKEGFQGRIDDFVEFFQKNLRICLVQNQERTVRSRSRQSNFSQQGSRSASKSNSLRFSFEQALQKSRKTRRTNENDLSMNQLVMNPLYQQNESQLEQSINCSEKRQNAFRNLFPDDPDESFEQRDFHNYKRSPVFKEF